MYKKKPSTHILHKIFSFLPDSFLHLFGTCKSACKGLAMEDDIDAVKSTKVKVHLKVCPKCWNYYHQMCIVNKKIVQALKSEVDSKSDKIASKKAIEDLANRFSK